MKNNPHFKFQISNLSNERGVALLMVLWVFIFLFVVAFDFTALVREEGIATRRYAEETEGYYLALAGFQQRLYELLKDSSRPRQVGGLEPGDLFDGEWQEGNLGQGVYDVRSVDESGKININRVNEISLRCIFTKLQIEEPHRSVLADSILDWRDDDDLHRLNGAEKDYYHSLSPSYTAKNGPFDAVEELLWVRGVTPEIFYGEEKKVGLKEIFTVESPIDRVNLRTLSPEVCLAVSGLSLDQCREFKKLSDKTLADLLKLAGGSELCVQMVSVSPSVITVEAKGRAGESASARQVKGVVRLAGGQRGFELIRWVDRDLVKNEE